MLATIVNAFQETLYMVFVSEIFTILIGIPLGFSLYGFANKNFFENKILYYVIRLPLAFLSATPYLLITIFSLPFIKSLIDSNSNNTMIAVLPLTIAAIPMYSLLMFDALKNIPNELTETAKSFGATLQQTIFKFYLPEILPSLVQATSKTLIQLIAYSTIAGLFGGGGIGALMIQKGYYSFELSYIIICSLLLVATIQFIQFYGNFIAKQMVNDV